MVRRCLYESSGIVSLEFYEYSELIHLTLVQAEASHDLFLLVSPYYYTLEPFRLRLN